MLLNKEPPAMWSIAKKIQYHLNTMGFETGGIDGLFGVKSSSALILLQYYMDKKKVTGKVDNTALNIVKAAVNNKLTYSKVKEYVDQNWRKTPPSIEINNFKKNGHLSVENMVRIPTSSFGDAIAEKSAAISWAMLVKSANEYNKAVSNENMLDIGNFAVAGLYGAYRPYHYQVEAYINYRHGGNPAACPTFTNGGKGIARANRFNANNAIAEAWINRNWNSFIDDGKWNDVPENITRNGGDLEGYGHSDHGWGLAIDFCTGGEKSGRSYDREVRWLERNAGKYGFYPLLDSPKTFPDGSNNYKETWHWSYNFSETLPGVKIWS